MSTNHPSFFRENVTLAPYTTIGLGGRAMLFAECAGLDELREAVSFALERKMRWMILGGGSNVIFRDDGFGGLVIRIALSGTAIEDDGDSVLVRSGAGEVWDSLVQRCVDRGWQGIECLSGIPGLVGATPIQNVGAYGQEVSGTIVFVEALDSATMNMVTFSNDECGFGYRQSRFKGKDRSRYIITGTGFRLRKDARAELRYPELARFIRATYGTEADPDPGMVREAVLSLRRKKSMVVDRADPNSRSVGSFFINPVISKDNFTALEKQWRESGGTDPIPRFTDDDAVKIPAAWLVEHAGFPKGYRGLNVRISSNHALALVNDNGTARSLLDLAEEIRNGVRQRFGIVLDTEPTIID